jgi:2,5-diketo-D-gluconate reductase A
MTAVPALTLNQGDAIPQIGLGTWPLDDETVIPAILSALEAGYRHIDTAVRYGNEVGVGRAISASGVPREELFVTTKLDGPFQGDDRAIAGLDESLRRLGLDYVDLLLMHWPLPSRDQYVSTWRTFEKLQAAGKARAIGVSNFKPAHLERLAAQSSAVPTVNQVQLSPFTPRHADREYAAAHGIVIASYSPIGRGRELLETAQIRGIATKHGKSPAQIVLRWHVQQGLVPIPKSANPTRIRENLDVYGFDLGADDLAALAELDRGPGAGIDSDREGH